MGSTRASCYDVPSWKLESVLKEPSDKDLSVYFADFEFLNYLTKIFSHGPTCWPDKWPMDALTFYPFISEERKKGGSFRPTSSCISFGTYSHEWVRLKTLGEGEGAQFLSSSLSAPPTSTRNTPPKPPTNGFWISFQWLMLLLVWKVGVAKLLGRGQLCPYTLSGFSL